MHAYTVIKKAITTEKSMKESESGRYTFIVDRRANKRAISQAIALLFNVTVVGVLTSTLKGKTKRVGKRRTTMQVSPVKKAVVILKQGQKLGSSTDEQKEKETKK